MTAIKYLRGQHLGQLGPHWISNNLPNYWPVIHSKMLITVDEIPSCISFAFDYSKCATNEAPLAEHIRSASGISRARCICPVYSSISTRPDNTLPSRENPTRQKKQNCEVSPKSNKRKKKETSAKRDNFWCSCLGLGLCLFHRSHAESLNVEITHTSQHTKRKTGRIKEMLVYFMIVCLGCRLFNLYPGDAAPRLSAGE